MISSGKLEVAIGHLLYEKRFSPLPCRKLCYLHLVLKELWKLPVLVEEKDYAKERLEVGK